MATEMSCRLCNRTLFQCGGWLERVNEEGGAGIWECRPNCDAKLTEEQALLGAVEDGKDVITMNARRRG